MSHIGKRGDGCRKKKKEAITPAPVTHEQRVGRLRRRQRDDALALEAESALNFPPAALIGEIEHNDRLAFDRWMKKRPTRQLAAKGARPHGRPPISLRSRSTPPAWQPGNKKGHIVMPSRSAAFNGASVVRRQDDIPTALESGSLFDWRKYLRIHPAAELFPLMKEKDIEGFNALVENIRVHGLAEKIVGWSSSEGVSVLDGRNRIDALAQLGLLCEMPDHLVGIKKWTGKEWSDQGVTRIAGHDGAFRNLYDHNGNPYDIALPLNVHRRHLTAEQKRDLIAKLLKAKPEASNLLDRQADQGRR